MKRRTNIGGSPGPGGPARADFSPNDRLTLPRGRRTLHPFDPDGVGVGEQERANWRAGLWLVLAWLVPCGVQAHSKVVVETVHSRALEGNRIGDTSDRAVTIYLPPSYAHSPDRRYPVVYLLHGATSDPKEWFDGSYQGMDLKASLDAQAAAGEFIVVMPMADNRYGGGFYVNSPAFGNWEDFVARELVAYVDQHFRTLPVRASRGLAGQSMGGFGALYLAGRHDKVFGHVYAVSPCCLDFVGELSKGGKYWTVAPAGLLKSMALAFGPDPGGDVDQAVPPVPYRAGTDGNVKAYPEVIHTWQRYLPTPRLVRDPKPYRRLCSIGLEAGTQDHISNVTLGAEAFSLALSRAGIAHDFVEYPGGHVDHARERFEAAMIPFFAKALASPGHRGTCARD